MALKTRGLLILIINLCIMFMY